MSRFVLDASALIAFLNEEPGWENLPDDADWETGALISAVNAAEVETKYLKDAREPKFVWEAISACVAEIVPYDQEQAKLCGDLVSSTRKLGLSLGDRACLALGLTLGLPVYTADRPWSKLKLAIEIHSIR
ncbi:PIN domain-containing protein [Silvibacterium acidisoli]|uniref:PIN domain-containing protein n=1 Tax=Acidobacteriaceae bacterium ZG23-2 TaxID=2883246 RepID=UPI00406CB1F7